MAQVPYDQGVPSVTPDTTAPDDYQRERATSEEAGGLVAKGLENLGQGTEKASENIFDIAKHVSDVNIDDQTNWYVKGREKILSGDPSKTTLGPDGKPVPDNGYFGLQGRAASDQRDAVLKQLEDLRLEGRKNLKNPYEQLEYDKQTRRMYTDSEQRVGLFADQQWKSWAGNVNATGSDLALAAIARQPNDLEEFKHQTTDLINFRVKESQLKFGDDPTITQQTVDQAKAEATAARLQAVAVKEPARALSMADNYKNTLSVVDKKTGQSFYDQLTSQFRGRANQQKSIGLADLAITKAGGDAPAAVVPVGAQVSPDAVHGAIIGRESGGNPLSPTSVDNAHGIGQITPATFKQFAKPGENIDDPVDNFNVSRRITDNYYKQYNGDPQRVAVAYFSGPGNVAPAGSPTPWVRDAADGNGVRTSAYVAGITQRLTGAAAVKGSAYRYVMEQPDVDPVVRNEALTEINRRYTAAQIAADADTKAQKAANDAAADKVVQRIGHGDFKNIIGDIVDNPSLTWETKLRLQGVAEKASGEESPASYGTGFNQVWADILRPPGDPQRIADPIDVLKRGGQGGDLTFPGTQKALTILKEAQKDINGQGLQQILNGAVTNAKKQLTFETQFPTGGGIHDPAGEKIFNTTFMNAFWSQYDSWVSKGNDPHDFPLLDPKKMDVLTNKLRPRAQMNADRIIAEGQSAADVPGQPAQELPTTPESLDPAAWAKVVSQPPTSTNGQPWPYKAWGDTIEKLRKNPTPEMIEAFDKKFQTPGMAKSILGTLGGGPEKPKDNAPAPEETLADMQPAAQPTPGLETPISSREGAGPAGYLGNLIRSVTPQKVQDYVGSR